MFKTFLLFNTWAYFYDELAIWNFDKTIILWHDLLFYENFLDFLSIFWGAVLWIVTSCSFFVWKLNQTVRFIILKDVFLNFGPYFVKLLGMITPVRNKMPEINKNFFWTFGYKFGITKWFIVACILQECCQINEYFCKIVFRYFTLQFCCQSLSIYPCKCF